MCKGAIKGLAGLKFSASPKRFGEFDTIIIIRIMIIIIVIESLAENSGWNLTLSRFVKVLFGLEDPFSCRRIKWISIMARITMGNKKWSEKNRFRVGWETEGPPQIHTTRSVPKIGIAESTPVITVAPQNDICPHGRMYPKKAVAIVTSMIMTPDIHTFSLFPGEEKYTPRMVCVYIKMKNKEAPFMWIIRVNHPFMLSRIIIVITENEVFVSAEYIIDKISPETICRVSVIPSRKPIFHIIEIEDGVGRSRRDAFNILRIGFFFISWFFIKMMKIWIGSGGDFGWRRILLSWLEWFL